MEVIISNQKLIILGRIASFDNDETINHISKCKKLAQNEQKNRHNWMGKLIHLELCKKLKFHQTNKWYLNKPESVLKNEMYKILWDYEIRKISKLADCNRGQPEGSLFEV